MNPKILTLATFACAFAAAALDGSNGHYGALILRTGLVAYLFWAWPKNPDPNALDPSALFERRWMWGPITATIALIVGLATSPVPGLGLQSMVNALLVTLLFLALLKRHEDIAPMVLGLFFAAATICIWALAETLLGKLPRTGFFNANHLAAWLLPLGLWLLVQHEPLLKNASAKTNDILKHILALAFLATALLTRSRTAVLVVALAVPFFTVPLLARLKSRPGPALALLTGGLCLLALGLKLSWVRWLGIGDAFAYERLAIWKSTLGLILEKPLGVGLGYYAQVMPGYGVPVQGLVHFPKEAFHAHNEVLQVVAETGVFGAIAVGTALVTVLLCLKGRDSKQSAAHVAITLAFAIPAMLSASLHVPLIALGAALWAAYLAHQNPNTTSDTANENLFRLPLALRFAPIALLLITLPDLAGYTLKNQAAKARDEGALELAKNHAQLAADLTPWREGPQLLKLSLDYLLGKNLDATKEALKELSERFPHSPKALQRLAALLEQNTKPQEGVPQALTTVRQKLLQRRPTDGEAYVRLAMLHLAQGQGPKAAALLQQGLAIEPNLADALAIGAMMHAHEKPNQAKAMAERALELDRSAKKYQGHARNILELLPQHRTLCEDILGPKAVASEAMVPQNAEQTP